jgi:myo-inositol-1(or 4)-monophosphatase
MIETSVAIQLARQAGDILRAGWGRRDLQVEQKGVNDPVSEIDRQSEALVTAGLRQAFPDYDILAEEGSSLDRGAEVRWIVDPLDGTTNYLRSYPLVAVAIGLEKQGKLVMGVVYNPILDELFAAESGGGATFNGRPIRTSQVSELGKATLASGFPYDAWTVADNNSRAWSDFVRRCWSMRCDGSAALDLCHAACGRVDGYWERGLSPWDIAAGAVIAAEAGAWVGDYLGGSGILEKGEVVAANPILAQQIRDVLRK